MGLTTANNSPKVSIRKVSHPPASPMVFTKDIKEYSFPNHSQYFMEQSGSSIVDEVLHRWEGDGTADQKPQD